MARIDKPAAVAEGASYDARVPRSDAASREIASSPEAAFKAFVDPAALAVWLPPAGMTARFERFDMRPGGSYRMVLTYSSTSGRAGKTGDGTDVVEARIVEVVDGVRLTQQIDFESDDPRFAGKMTMTWSLTPTARGVRVEIRADDVPDGISAEDHATGMNASLHNLESYLTNQPLERGR